MENKKNTHGGRRTGAGRKPMPVGERRVQLSVRVLPITVERLRAHPKSQGKAIDDAIAAMQSGRHIKTKG